MRAKLTKFSALFLILACIFLVGLNPTGDNDSKSPLNLKWGSEPSNRSIGRPVLKDYSYMFGTPSYGQIRYRGKSDTFDMSSELILYYVDRKLSSSLLILGPGGLNEDNCISKYKDVVTGLNLKYGFYRNSEKKTDSLIDDLIFVKKCHAVKLGLEFITHKWHIKNFRIESYLYGDEETIFIEIEYYYLFLEKKEKKQNIKKQIEKL